MELGQLVSECRKAMAAGRMVQLTFARDRPPGGRRVQLAGPGSPLGEVACVQQQTGAAITGSVLVVAWYSPRAVLKWFAGSGFDVGGPVP